MAVLSKNGQISVQSTLLKPAACFIAIYIYKTSNSILVPRSLKSRKGENSDIRISKILLLMYSLLKKLQVMGITKTVRQKNQNIEIQEISDPTDKKQSS